MSPIYYSHCSLAAFREWCKFVRHCYSHLEPVECEAEKVGGASLYLQQGADKDGPHRQTVARGHRRQGPGHPHLAPLYLSSRLQHPAVRSGQVSLQN